MGRFRRKAEERVIARRRIDRLFALAHHRVLEDQGDLADRAVRLGRRIAMRYQTGLTPTQRDHICRRCNGYLAPGKTARVRIEGGMKRTTCLACLTVYRRPYLREQKERRRARERLRAGTGPAQDKTVPPDEEETSERRIEGDHP